MDVSSRLPPHERRRLAAIPGGDLDELIRRRLAGEPLQYLEGSAAFADLEVLVDERVLIPRPETEGLYELAATEAKDPRLVVDIGTGSGVLAIALARRFPAATVHAVDTSASALEVARENARRYHLAVEFHRGSLFSALPEELRGEVDLVVSNPPYVATDEWHDLPADVRREPREALVAGPTGTEIIEEILAEVEAWLTPGGVFASEIGEAQGASLLAAASLAGARVVADLTGRDRYLLWRKPE